MGIIKRKVEPDSPQSRVALFVGIDMGLTLKVLPSRTIFAPSEFKQDTVASISLFVYSHIIFVGDFAREAQISALCASDFEEIAGTVPESAGELRIFSMITPRERRFFQAP